MENNITCTLIFLILGVGALIYFYFCYYFKSKKLAQFNESVQHITRNTDISTEDKMRLIWQVGKAYGVDIENKKVEEYLGNLNDIEEYKVMKKQLSDLKDSIHKSNQSTIEEVLKKFDMKDLLSNELKRLQEELQNVKNDITKSENMDEESNDNIHELVKLLKVYKKNKSDFTKLNNVEKNFKENRTEIEQILTKILADFQNEETKDEEE